VKRLDTGWMTTRLVLALAALPHQGAWADDPLARPVAGRSFDEFVQAALQDYAVPGQSLGMVRSGPTEAELFKDDNRAADHNFDGSIMPYENVDAFSGAGAVVSTGADIARWMRTLLGAG
jgi:CubicO group peptidase (beta-lactamase class C family)